MFGKSIGNNKLYADTIHKMQRYLRKIKKEENNHQDHQYLSQCLKSDKAHKSLYTEVRG